MQATPNPTLSLDVGQVRVGVAIARAETGLAVPLVTLTNDADFLAKLQEIILQESIRQLVVGLPRGLDSQDTPQTTYVRSFAAQLGEALGLPIHLQDEALTSHKAEQELQARRKAYTKEDVDALSATYILEDYLQGGAA